MKRILTCLFILLSAFGCKKKDDLVQDPLHKKWYLHKIERIYTDKVGNPHPDFSSWSDVANDRERFIEFTSDGQMLTYEGNGSYTKSSSTITYKLPNVQDAYDYSFQGEMLILSYQKEGITYNEKAIFTMKPF